VRLTMGRWIWSVQPSARWAVPCDPDSAREEPLFSLVTRGQTGWDPRENRKNLQPALFTTGPLNPSDDDQKPCVPNAVSASGQAGAVPTGPAPKVGTEGLRIPLS